MDHRAFRGGRRSSAHLQRPDGGDSFFFCALLYIKKRTEGFTTTESDRYHERRLYGYDEDWRRALSARFALASQNTFLTTLWSLMNKEITALSRITQRTWTCCHQQRANALCAHPCFPLLMIFHHPEIPWNLLIFRNHCDPSTPKDLFLFVSRRHYYLHHHENKKLSRKRYSHHHRRLGNPVGHGYQDPTRIVLVHRCSTFDATLLEQTLHHTRSHYGIPFRRLSRHPRLPLALVLRHDSRPWDYAYLMMNRRWSRDQILWGITTRRMNFRQFSHNPYLRLPILVEFIDRPWDWKVLAVHPAFPPYAIWEYGGSLVQRWHWSATIRHPRLDPGTFHRMRTLFHGRPLGLLDNRFVNDPFLRSVAGHTVQKNVSACVLRRRCRARLYAIHCLGRRLPLALLDMILSFVRPQSP